MTLDDKNDARHERLKASPFLWASIGVSQTLLSAGVIFGWASLLPVLREEGVDHSPAEFSLIFTYGAVGNYISTLFFGYILDRFGPKTTGITASLLFAAGLLLCTKEHNLFCLALGFALLGFAGPGVQMPTLHLANLFSGKAREGGGAIFMSAQAAAFDGGTAVFAIFRLLHQTMGLSSSSFFLLYLVVPAWVLLTAVFVWPSDIIENQDQTEDYIGAGSPYLSPAGRRTPKPKPKTASLVNAPLSVVLRQPAFYALAIWVSVHILKLNFVVATINDQLDENVEQQQADHLIDAFGAMLPFGFVVLPIVASLLETSAMGALQLANFVGLLYGGILSFYPGNAWLQALLVFPSIAISRQMVYSTVFHQIGQVFGFANYGVLLGLTNVLVSSFSLVQTPLVHWSETVGSYFTANLLLWIATIPLFVIVLWSDPLSNNELSSSSSTRRVTNEKTPLNRKLPEQYVGDRQRMRSNSHD